MSKGTNIYFIRHGQVQNRGNIFYGRLPRVKLSEEGKKQIEEAAMFLVSKNINIIIVSPLLRTRQSAQILSEKLKIEKVLISTQIIEIGSFLEGKTVDFAKKINFNHFDPRYQRPRNETFDNVIQRMTTFLNKTYDKFQGKNILVVTHGDPLMILKASTEKLPKNIESIRPGKEKYVTYGEVWSINNFPDCPSIKSIFKPN